PFGWTAPGWSFDWGWSPAAVPWILQNAWEYYEYTGDLEFMKTKIYPMLKEEAVLYEQMLIKDPATGKLVCSPAYSPEHGPRTNGNTYEQSLIWQMYDDVITAGKLVGENPEKIKQWESIKENLKGPIEIGDSGQIKEWYEETTLGSLGEKGHRHMSHLLG
ncbi:glycosyl hydrolase family 95 catalytic domain-containing protein, partial [Clostridium perfringens]